MKQTEYLRSKDLLIIWLISTKNFEEEKNLMFPNQGTHIIGWVPGADGHQTQVHMPYAPINALALPKYYESITTLHDLA